VIEWGFEKESEAVGYFRVILQNEGYQIGQEWAEKQEDLDVFEEFYDEWNEGRLTGERLDMLLYTVDIASIIK
jgi:hypothetical protein